MQGAWVEPTHMSLSVVLILLALGGIVGGGVGYFLRFFISLGQKGSMELQVRKMMLDAEERAKKVVEDAGARGQEKVEQLTSEFKGREKDLKSTEERLVRKEEMLDSRQLKFDTDEANLAKKAEEVVAARAKADELVHAQQHKLESVANLSAEEAKSYGLIDNVITSRGEIVDPQVIAAQATAGK